MVKVMISERGFLGGLARVTVLFLYQAATLVTSTTSLHPSNLPTSVSWKIKKCKRYRSKIGPGRPRRLFSVKRCN
jgi:hypothetical protein